VLACIDRKWLDSADGLGAFHGLAIGPVEEKIRDLGLWGVSQRRACYRQISAKVSVEASWLHQ
jgi:hypothetical protein